MFNFRKKYTLGLLIFIRTILFGQVGNTFPIKLDSIKLSGVDTFFIYKPYCYSDGIWFPENATETEIHEKECDQDNQTFVFYRLNGNTFVTKYNKCYKFHPIQINTSPSFSYFILHHTELIKDSIRDARVKNKDGTTSIVGIDHSCYRNIYMFLNQSKYFNIDLYDFNKDVYTGRNINLEYNEKTYIKKFIDIISNELENLKFTRQPDQ